MPWKGDQLFADGDPSAIMCEGCGGTHFTGTQLQDKMFLAGAWYYERRIEWDLKCKKCGTEQMQWVPEFDMKTGQV
ncbi:MAG TPA: hypothetical protein VI893_00630 [Thermoplasmata archaeon]|nr:hypothetical protein [Thermoplasmata archaeon]